MGASMLLVKAITYLSKYMQFFQWLLKDGKENPFEAIAYAAASIVFVIGVGWKAAEAFIS
jgi:hypothetical protein